MSGTDKFQWLFRLGRFLNRCGGAFIFGLGATFFIFPMLGWTTIVLGLMLMFIGYTFMKENE